MLGSHGTGSVYFTEEQTPSPSAAPTGAPSPAPTAAPSEAPTAPPTAAPTKNYIINGPETTSTVSSDDSDKYRVNGNIYVKKSLFVKEKAMLMNDEFETVLNGDNGLYVYARKE